MTTTAEGVETREQLDLVRRLGCTDAQGFFYSPPVLMFTKRRKVSFAAA
jgi:EAL domain-containing protein (putative c-di-GMP-specific phosphodiesterase class I)